FILDKGGSISGFVYEADGVTPVVDASVSAINTNERGEWLGDNTMTRVDGSYTIDHLVPYDYWVSVSKNGFGYQLYDGKFFEGEKDFVSVVAGENNSDINFILQPGGLLQIRYIDEENGEKIQQHIEVFVQDAFTQDRVTVAPVELWLNPGVYKINLGQGHPYLPEWYENAESYETATPIEIIAGETTSVEMILTPIGTITGVVYDQDGETPLADVSVFAFPISDDYPGAGANTDENGRYTIEGLASGSYRVAASLTGYQTLYFGDAVEEATATLVTVNAPDQTSDIDIILTPE
ncbi:MAG: carboxypeptidase regulatory-like domain-containing protein, partial [Chloroflexi bacterium]